jgi:hypothetical protein
MGETWITIYVQAAESEVTMRSFERKDEEERRTNNSRNGQQNLRDTFLRPLLGPGNRRTKRKQTS